MAALIPTKAERKKVDLFFSNRRKEMEMKKKTRLKSNIDDEQLSFFDEDEDGYDEATISFPLS
jgi:hypothetical protein